MGEPEETASARELGSRLSPQQRRLWRMGGRGSEAYVAQCAVMIEGPLDLDRLAAVLTQITQRHEILRTRIATRPGAPDPLQWVMPPEPQRLERLDEAAPNGRGSIATLLARAAERMDRGPADGFPLFATLVPRGPTSHLLLLSVPSLFADAASLERLFGELALGYAHDPSAGSAQDAESLEVIQYANVAEWENELQDGEAGAAGRRFWESLAWPEEVAGTLPFELPPAPDAPFAPVSIGATAGRETTGKLGRTACEFATSTSTVLLACYAVLLWRFTNRSDVVIGTAFDGRGYEELEGGVGLFVRYLPIHVPLESAMPFRIALARTEAAVAQAREWQELFDWDVTGPRLGQGGPAGFFPFCFDFDQLPPPAKAGDVTFTMVERQVGWDRYKIRLSGLHRSNDLRLTAHYDASRFAEPYVQRVLDGVRAILDDAGEDPERRVDRLDIVGPAERHRLIVAFNDTITDYPRERCIHDFIEEQAARHPDHPAAEFEGQSLTYGELNARANRLARYLQRSGVGPDTPVAVCVERSLEMIVGVLGVLKAGGAYVPLDAKYPRERLAFMLDDTQAPVLLTLQRLAPNLPAHRARVIHLDAHWPEIAQESDEPARRTVTPDHMAYVIYTSGSTGKPKGVMVTHRTLVISNEARIGFYGTNVTKFLLLSPFAFDSSVVGIFWTLCVGGTILLVREDTQQDVLELTNRIATQQVSHLLTLPSFYSLLLQHGDAKQLEGLATVIVAGEACPKKMVHRHRQLLPKTRLYSEYGATETTVWSSAYDCFRQELDTAPLGQPIANSEMYVLDGDLQPLPVGLPGEVHFGGDILAKGYWNRPDLNAEKFIPNPFSDRPDARLYRSGDLARHLPNGDLEFLGRIDNQVKIRGFRVELEEIEAVLSQHPLVGEVVVVARDASEWELGPSSDGDANAGKRLVGYVSPVGSSGLAAEDLRDYLRARLPAYMVPVTYVTLERLPKTPNGKIDRRALPAPTQTRGEPLESAAAPRSPTEIVLAGIWKKLLGVDNLGRDDNFFELGGDSILSIQVIAQANQAGLKLTPRDLFERQTVAELAEVVGAVASVQAEQGMVIGNAPLHPIQHWLLDQDRPEPHHANIAELLEVGERLEPGIVKRVVERLIEHHDALRIRFVRVASGWRQWHADRAGQVPVRYVDLSAVPPDEQRAAIEAEALQAQTSLDLGDGPMLRVVYFDLGSAAPSRLLFVVHHLVFDGVSWRILLEDFQQAYRQLAGEEAIRLPPKTTSFKAWTERLVEYAASADVRQELDYWLDVSRDAEGRLPVDQPEGRLSNSVASQCVVSCELNSAETRELLHDVPKAYQSRIDEALLTALVQCFYRWTGNPTLFLDLEGHGREALFDGLDVSRTVGWLTTVYPVRLRLEPGLGPGEALQAVKEQVRTIPNRGFGYGVLRYLSDAKDVRNALAWLPKPEANFNYLGQFDQVLSDSSMFRPARESTGPDFSGLGNRPHLLEIVGIVVDGRLRIDWMYSDALHRRETVERLAQDFIGRLRALIAHCASPDAGGYLLSDFAEFSWDQSDLDDVAFAIRQARGEA